MMKMFNRKKDLLKEGERFMNKELPRLQLPNIEHEGKSWSFREHVDGMVYVEGKLESGLAAKGAIRIYKVQSDGESNYAVVRLMFVGEKKPRVYIIAMEKMLSDATMRFKTKAMAIIDTLDATEEDKELIKSKLRAE